MEFNASVSYFDSEREASAYDLSPASNLSSLQETSIDDFDAMYTSSVIAQQQWPWTMLVDTDTHRVFFRNEVEDSFQLEAPPEFKTKAAVDKNLKHDDKSVLEKQSEIKHEIIERSKYVESNRQRLKVSDSFLKGLQQLVEPESKSISKVSKSRRQAMILKHSIAGGDSDVDHFQESHRNSRPSSVFRLSAVAFISSYSYEELNELDNPIPSPLPVHDTEITLSHPPQPPPPAQQDDAAWQEALVFLDRLKRMDVTYPSSSSNAKQNNKASKGNKLRNEIQKMRKSREKTDKLKAFSATGRNVPRTFAPGVRGLALSTSAAAPNDTGSDLLLPELASSMPSRFMKALQLSKFKPEVIVRVEKANPSPIVGLSSSMKLGDLMSKFQTAKARELEDDARARRALALDALQDTYDDLRKTAYTAKQQADVVRSHVCTMNNLMDHEDTGWLASQIMKRHLLEATVLLQGSMISPHSDLDDMAYQALPKHILRPHSLNPDELLVSALEDGKLAVENDSRWGKLTLDRSKNTQVSGTKDANKTQQKLHYYIDRHGRGVQTGLPFDMKFRAVHREDRRRVAEAVFYGKRIEEVPVSLRRAHKSRLHSQPPKPSHSDDEKMPSEILVDAHGGLMFHCPQRHVFWYDESMGGAASRYESQRADEEYDRPRGDSIEAGSSNHHGQARAGIWEALSLAAPRGSRADDAANTAPQPEPITEDEESYLRFQKLLQETVSSQAVELVASASESAISNLFGFRLPPDELSEGFLPEMKESSSPGRIQKSRSSMFETAQSIPSLLASTAPLTTSLENIDSTEMISSPFAAFEPRDAATVVESEGKNLTFETYLTSAEEDEDVAYQKHLVEVYRRPCDVVALMSLAKYLLSRGCGKESLVTVARALECLTLDENKVSEKDSCLLHILATRMYAMYVGEFANHDWIRKCSSDCSSASPVLGHAAKFMSKVKLSKIAQELYISALLLDPLNPDALRGYALMLAEEGHYPLACKYLSRVEASDHGYSSSRTEKGWILELIGESDAVMHAYQKVIGLGLRDRATSNALSSMGHLSHVRGDFPRALGFYRRSLAIFPNNSLALILRGTLSASNVLSRHVGIAFEGETVDSLEEICASFRRGLFFLKGSSRWIGLLAYGEMLACIMHDLNKAERVLWDASNASIGSSIWASIALVHFYQYSRTKRSVAKRILVRSKLLRFESTKGKVDLYSVDDFVAIQVVSSHLCIETGDIKAAEAAASSALEQDPSNSAALRCAAIIAWKLGNSDKALKLIEKSISDRPHGSAEKQSTVKNAYSLRSASVLFAFHGKYALALSTMQSAVAVGGLSCPLAWRALGIMTYLFGRNVETETRNDVIWRSIDYLDRANALFTDVEACMLKGQMLMEVGQYLEAEIVLRNTLSFAPLNPILLASLAMCLAALGYKSPSGVDRIDYQLKLSRMPRLTDVIFSDDPQELFEVATSKMIDSYKERIRSTATKKAKDALEKLSLPKHSSKHETEFVPLMSISGNSLSDALPEVLYWYGMHQLHVYTIKKNRISAKEKAKELFVRAVMRKDCAPYPLAIYMLGWLSELDGDMDEAERYYCYAAQVDPIEPITLLRLAVLASNTLKYVSALTSASETRDHRIRKAQERRNAILAYKITRKSSEYVEEEDEFEDGAEEFFAQGGPTEGWANGFVPTKKGFKVKMNKGKTIKFKVPDISTMRTRLLVHGRVTHLMELRCSALKKYLAGLNTPNTFVSIDTFWCERLFQAFSTCDDWASLLKSSGCFRN